MSDAGKAGGYTLNLPFVVDLFELLWDYGTPPLELGRGALLRKGALDEASIEVKRSDLGRRLRVPADGMQAGAPGPEGGGEPAEGGRALDGARLVEEREHCDAGQPKIAAGVENIRFGALRDGPGSGESRARFRVEPGDKRASAHFGSFMSWPPTFSSFGHGTREAGQRPRTDASGKEQQCGGRHVRRKAKRLAEEEAGRSEGCNDARRACGVVGNKINDDGHRSFIIPDIMHPQN